MTPEEIQQLRKSFEESAIVKHYNEKGEAMASHWADNSLRMKKGGAIKANAIRKPGQRSDAGKKGGDVNVQSGHWASLKTVEHQKSAGKKGGDVNVQSGHWAKVRSAGTKQSAINSTKKATEKAASILDALDKLIFSVSDLHTHIISLGYAKSYAVSFLKLANVELIKKVKYNNKETIYKKC